MFDDFDEDQRYDKLAHRLSASLVRRNLPPPAEDVLATELAEWFGAEDLDMSEAMHQGQRPDWHIVEINNPLLSPGYGGEVVSPSQEEALAFMLETIDTYHIYPDDVTLQDGVLGMWAKHKNLFLLRRASFETVDTAGRARAERCIKGVLAGDALERLVTRLRRLPGLGRIEPRRQPADFPVRRGGVVPFPPNWPVFLRKALLTLGLPVPLHQAQDLVATRRNPCSATIATRRTRCGPSPGYVSWRQT